MNVGRVYWKIVVNILWKCLFKCLGMYFMQFLLKLWSSILVYWSSIIAFIHTYDQPIDVCRQSFHHYRAVLLKKVFLLFFAHSVLFVYYIVFLLNVFVAVFCSSSWLTVYCCILQSHLTAPVCRTPSPPSFPVCPPGSGSRSVCGVTVTPGWYSLTLWTRGSTQRPSLWSCSHLSTLTTSVSNKCKTSSIWPPINHYSCLIINFFHAS